MTHFAPILLPRVGFDRVVLTAPRGGRSLVPLPERLGDYIRKRDSRSRTRAYNRCAQYHHVNDQTAPLVEILYQPTRPFRPLFRVVFRATMARLLDLEAVRGIVTSLASLTGGALLLCEIEVTLDFPQCRAPELRHLYVPRARQRRDHGSWFCIGSRNSAFSVRCYSKTEDGITAARLEVVARRDALRRHKINTIDDLPGVRWKSFAATRLEFPALKNHGACAHAEGQCYDESFATLGVATTLRLLPRGRRTSLRRQLVPLPVKHDVDRLLRKLQLKGPRQPTSQET